MKKKLLFLILVMILIPLTSCDTSTILLYNHEFNPSYDSEYHFDVCECGETINKEEHTFKTEVIKEATCSEVGQIKHYCDCGYFEIEEIPMLEHEYDEWETSIEATCVSKGQLKRTCKNCGHEEYKETNKAAHTPIAYTDLDASCTHEGHLGGSYCSLCGTELESATTIDKKDHNYGEWKITISPTCKSVGQEKRVCKDCNHEEYREVQMLEHTVATYSDEPSTCLVHGHTGGTYCSECNKKLSDSTELPLSDHNYSIELITKQPTLNEEGIKEHRCSECGHSYEEVLPRLSLTESIWTNSLTANSFNNKYIELVYMDLSKNEYYDITLMNKDTISYIKIYDNISHKTYEYYYNKNEVVESCVGGYRHRLYDSSNDPFNEYKDILIKAIQYSSAAYNKVEYDATNKMYLASNISISNYLNEEEIGTVGIKINNDGNLEQFGYSSNKYFINIQQISSSPAITIPDATHHTIGADGKCECCSQTYNIYSVTKDDFNLHYYVNKNTNEVEFDYDLLNNRSDVTFLEPMYYKDNKLTRFTSLYYESSPYIDKVVKSYTINSNKLLKITYSDNTEERLLLLSDNSAITVSDDLAYAYNPYNGNVIGQTFELLLPNNKTRRYKIVSDTELQILEYNEINYFIINDKEIVDFNRNLSNIIGYTCMSNNGNGIKPDGTNDFIYFVLSSNLSLEITYTYLNGTKAFNTITFKNITGYYINGNKDIYIYFMGDNENYVLHYNSNIEIIKI